VSPLNNLMHPRWKKIILTPNGSLSLCFIARHLFNQRPQQNIYHLFKDHTTTSKVCSSKAKDNAYSFIHCKTNKTFLLNASVCNMALWCWEMRRKRCTDTSKTDSHIPWLGFGLSCPLRNTTQTLYNFWFALWLVAKVMNRYIMINEQSKFKHIQRTKQCFKMTNMSQNDTKHALSVVRHWALWLLLTVIELSHLAQKTAIDSKAQSRKTNQRYKVHSHSSASFTSPWRDFNGTL